MNKPDIITAENTTKRTVSTDDADGRTAANSDNKFMQGLPRRVLVVDDNADAARMLGLMMEFKGHDCQVAFDGETALRMGKTYRPEFVFLDLGMPKMNGYDLCRQMRQIPELVDTVFIAQTGWSDPAYVASAKEAGFHRYLVKPFTDQELDRVLSKTGD